MENKPFSIYRFNQYSGKTGIWEKYHSFETMTQALHSLLDLTKRSKKHRIYVYTLLPNEHRSRYILVKHHEQLLKSAR